MKLRIRKWGSGVVLCIPMAYARKLGLKQGDQVRLRLTVDGGISVRTVQWDRNAFAQELASMRDAMPMTTRSVMEELRHGARY